MSNFLQAFLCMFGMHVDDKHWDPDHGFWARCVHCKRRVSRNENERAPRDLGANA